MKVEFYREQSNNSQVKNIQGKTDLGKSSENLNDTAMSYHQIPLIFLLRVVIKQAVCRIQERMD